MAQTLGCTIYEAQHRICEDEFLIWLSYRERYGSLSVSTTMKWYGALNTYATMIAAGADENKVKITNYLPPNWEGEDEEDTSPMTQEQVHAMMQQLKMVAMQSGGGRRSKSKYVVRKSKEDNHGN